MKWRVDLGTYNLDLLPRQEARACLRSYRAKLLEGIACYRRLVKYMEGCGCSTARCAVARWPIYLFQGEIRWVDAFIAELKRR